MGCGISSEAYAKQQEDSSRGPSQTLAGTTGKAVLGRARSIGVEHTDPFAARAAPSPAAHKAPPAAGGRAVPSSLERISTRVAALGGAAPRAAAAAASETTSAAASTAGGDPGWDSAGGEDLPPLFAGALRAVRRTGSVAGAEPLPGAGVSPASAPRRGSLTTPIMTSSGGLARVGPTVGGLGSFSLGASPGRVVQPGASMRLKFTYDREGNRLDSYGNRVDDRGHIVAESGLNLAPHLETSLRDLGVGSTSGGDGGGGGDRADRMAVVAESESRPDSPGDMTSRSSRSIATSVGVPSFSRQGSMGAGDWGSPSRGVGEGSVSGGGSTGDRKRQVLSGGRVVGPGGSRSNLAMSSNGPQTMAAARSLKKVESMRKVGQGIINYG